MRRREALLLLGLGTTVALLAGCSTLSRKLTFIRPDPQIKGYTQIAPEYHVRDTPGDRRREQVYAQLVSAKAQLERGELAAAEAQAQAALRLEPRSADAYTLLAVIADARGQDARSGGMFAKAVEVAPQQGAALNNYGAWLCANGRAAESLPLFERAAASPGYARPQDAWANAGACALKVGHIDEAAAPLQAALQREPGNAVALEAMADLAWRRGDTAQARDWIDRRLAAADASASSLQLASQISARLGDKAAADRYLQRLRTRFPQAAIRVDAQP